MSADDQLHPVLLRELRRLALRPDVPPEGHDWREFLRRVSLSYRVQEDDRYLLEQCLQISANEMQELNEQINYQATHDTLTGLPNRSALRQVIEELRTRPDEPDSPLTAMFIDLDEFKLVNDTLGHDVGDKLLAQAASRLRRQMRSTDTLARTGGDEFVALCPGLCRDEASSVAQRMLHTIRDPFVIDGHRILISASIGIAESDPLTSTDGVLVSADMAMYESKRLGRAQLTHFDAGVHRRMVERSQLEQDLRAALSSATGLVLHFQPIVSLRSGRISGFEALVRWNRAGVGMVAPDEFIPVAEQCGLITAIDRWVLNQACADAASWQSEATVSVNMTAIDLRDPDTVQAVQHALAESGLAARRLIIELTESAAMSGDERITSNLDRIRSLGVSLSIDDFGTGYSSLSYLGRMPARTLKIDRSFITDVPQDRDATAIVDAIVRLAQTLGLKVIVEGVETDAQCAAMIALGCDEAQGYYYSRPIPASQIPALLSQQTPTWQSKRSA